MWLHPFGKPFLWHFLIKNYLKGIFIFDLNNLRKYNKFKTLVNIVRYFELTTSNILSIILQDLSQSSVVLFVRIFVKVSSWSSLVVCLVLSGLSDGQFWISAKSFVPGVKRLCSSPRARRPAILINKNNQKNRWKSRSH